MNQKQNTKNDSTINVDELIRNAEKIGLTEIPESTGKIVSAMLQGMKNSRKIVTAKMLFDSLKVKNSKFFSDKLWNLAKRGQIVDKITGKVIKHGVVIKHETRGYYSYNFANEKSEEIESERNAD